MGSLDKQMRGLCMIERAARRVSKEVCFAVCCNVLQCFAVCCSVLQCVAVFIRGGVGGIALHINVCPLGCCSVLQYVAVCVAVCCSAL